MGINFEDSDKKAPPKHVYYNMDLVEDDENDEQLLDDFLGNNQSNNE